MTLPASQFEAGPQPRTSLAQHEFVPASLLENRGAKTPEDAVETYYWALAHGRADVLRQMLAATPSAVSSTDPAALLQYANRGVDGPLAKVRLDAAEIINPGTVYLTGRDITVHGQDLNYDLVAVSTPRGWQFVVNDGDRQATIASGLNGFEPAK